ncbi:MAG: 3-dehydroquinate synthase [Gammaproteobacteria bacterium]|nr:3-dehydroquinate synthase [Gammaproteobacteria bacterium]
MKTITVELGARSYPIYVGEGLLGDGALLRGHLAGEQVMVVSNDTVARLYMSTLSRALADTRCEQVILPDGEEHKNLEMLGRIFDALLAARFARDCTIVALGGGVVGDMAGFAAACYQRGVAYVQVPTTLLAQVDSSVGGKTAVNHPGGKNMIGAFHQPRCVLIDTRTLETLPERELKAGLAEVIKYGVMWDADFFAWLERHLVRLLAGDADALATAIERSCRIKAEVVATDERETGTRSLLNLGHTFGHAIEAGLGYGRWLHGEAVAAGICLAADLSARLGRLEPAAVARIESLVAAAGLPVAAPAEISCERMLELMAVDKKVKGGRVRLVLLDAIGKAELSERFDGERLRETLTERRQAA